MNVCVVTDVLLAGLGPGNSKRGTLETRKSEHKDEPAEDATNVCIFVPRVNTHCRGVAEGQSGWTDVSQLLSSATLVLVWWAREGSSVVAGVLVMCSSAGSLHQTCLIISVAESLTS